MTAELHQSLKNAGDALAVTGTVATVLGYLPEIAAGVTLVYTLVRLWESDTVQKLFKRKEK